MIAGRPGLVLLDARSRGLDEDDLRAWARNVAATTTSPNIVRSYRYPYALVAWHDARVGVDIERIAPCDEAFGAAISTSREPLPAAEERDLALSLRWSGKEALSKALGDALDYDPRRLDGPDGWSDGRAGRWRAERLEVPEGHVGWLCWEAPGGAPTAQASATIPSR